MNKEEMSKVFFEVFGEIEKKQLSYYFSPGRVNLIGEHIDFNGGYVLPCAISLGTYAVIRLRDDKEIRFCSMNFIEEGIYTWQIDSVVYTEEKSWSNYPAGMIKVLMEKGVLIDRGMDILFYGNLPNGAGLSSSASLEVLMGTILNDVFEGGLSKVEIALLSQLSENTFNGVNCGIMDQFAVANGQENHAIKLNCNTMTYEMLPLDLGQHKIVIINTNKKRGLVDSAYNQRRQECEQGFKELNSENDYEYICDLSKETFLELSHKIETENGYKRCRHAVMENERTILAADYLKNGDLSMFGQMMTLSHISLKEDYEVSCKELDVIVELGRPLRGVLGIRMTGAGFGGCAVAIVDEKYVEDFVEKVGNGYKASVGMEADFYVAEVGKGAGEWHE